MNDCELALDAMADQQAEAQGALDALGNSINHKYTTRSSTPTNNNKPKFTQKSGQYACKINKVVAEYPNKNAIKLKLEGSDIPLIWPISHCVLMDNNTELIIDPWLYNARIKEGQII